MALLLHLLLVFFVFLFLSPAQLARQLVLAAAWGRAAVLPPLETSFAAAFAGPKAGAGGARTASVGRGEAKAASTIHRGNYNAIIMRETTP